MSQDGRASPVAEALAEAVGQFGPSLAADSRRLRAVLADALGATARGHSAEIDAVVIAAEESIPTGLLSGSPDPLAALARLRARGVADDVAQRALVAWSAALGPQGPVAAPGDRATVLDAGATQRFEPTQWFGADPGDHPTLEVADDRLTMPPPPGPPPGPPARFGSFGQHAGWLVGLGVLIIGLLVLAVRAASDDDGPNTDTTTTTAATTTAPPTTTAPQTTTTARPTTTTARPTTTTTPAVAAVPPLAADDAYSYTPQTNDGATWYVAQLTVLANDTGVYDWVDLLSEPTHGRVIWDQTKNFFSYSPAKNGYVQDSFTYRVRDTRTGATSNVATVSITLFCNRSYACSS